MAFHSAAGQSRPTFQPQCTHLTMTRIYGLEFLCESCHRPGPFGWLYRCTQDREELIEHALSRGYTTAFDTLGEALIEELTVRKRSPAAREGRFSFFEEITPKEMSSYRPDQVAAILRQRDDLQVAIQRERIRKGGAAILGGLRQSACLNGFPPGSEYRKPWVCENDEECQYKVCPYCRPGASDRAFLSLNAVADGELLPTAATGFGFHVLGERPVVDANILRTIGLRQQPATRSELSWSDSSYTSELSMLELLDDQIARLGWKVEGHGEQVDDDAKLSPLPPASVSPGHLKHSPAYENLTAIAKPREFTSEGSSIRPPWTPPPSPSPFGRDTMAERHVLGLAAEPSFTNGRSSSSLKTNPSVRNQLFSSIPSTSALERIQQSYYSDASTHVPYLPESAYDVGLTLPFDEHTYDLARKTPLSPPDYAEQVYLHEPVSPMKAYEEDTGRFTPAPLKVDHGVAVLEESVELGVPDVITQA